MRQQDAVAVFRIIVVARIIDEARADALAKLHPRHLSVLPLRRAKIRVALHLGPNDSRADIGGLRHLIHAAELDRQHLGRPELLVRRANLVRLPLDLQQPSTMLKP